MPNVPNLPRTSEKKFSHFKTVTSVNDRQCIVFIREAWRGEGIEHTNNRKLMKKKKITPDEDKYKIIIIKSLLMAT